MNTENLKKSFIFVHNYYEQFTNKTRNNLMQLVEMLYVSFWCRGSFI